MLNAMSLILLGFTFGPLHASNGGHLEFHGAFAETSFQGDACKSVFLFSDYTTRHYVAGANHRTSVVNFSSPDKTGFFSGVTVVGLLGPENDIRDERTTSKDGITTHIVAEGIVSQDLLLLDVKVDMVRSDTSEVICTAQGQYSAFNRSVF